MTYFQLAAVKSDAGITDTNTDSMLNTFGADADSYCDNRLDPYITTEPIVNPDPSVIQASNMGTLARYFQANTQFDKAKQYFDLADKYLTDYITSLLETKTATKVPQYAATTSGNVMRQT